MNLGVRLMYIAEEKPGVGLGHSIVSIFIITAVVERYEMVVSRRRDNSMIVIENRDSM